MGSLVGGITQMATGIQQANDAEKTSAIQRNQVKQQADIAIDQARQQGAYTSGKVLVQGAQLAGQQKMAYANSGVDVTRGTAANVQANSAALNQLDAQQASINAAKQVWGYEEQKKFADQDYATRSQNINTQEGGAILGGMGKWGVGIAQLAGGGG